MLIRIKDYFKQLQLLHGALCFGILILLVVIKFVISKSKIKLNMEAVYFGVGLAMACVIVSRLVFIRIVMNNRTKTSIKAKLEAYRNAFVIYILILEGGAMFNAAVLFLFGSDINFATSLSLIFLMIIRRPTKKDVYRTMYPDNTQSTALDRDDKIII